MAEELNIKVSADTGEAVANLKKTEGAVAGVKKEVKTLDAEGKKSTAALGDSISKNVSWFTKLAEGAGKLTLIFGTAMAAGKALAAGIDAISAKMAKSDKAASDAAVNTIKFESALRLASNGTIALGRSTAEMLANYDAYIEKTQRSTTATDAAAKAIRDQKQAMDELGAAMEAAGKGAGFTILSPEDAEKMLDPIKSLATGLENAFKKAFEVGGEDERAKWAAANEEAVQKVVAAYEKAGLEIPEHLRAVAASRVDDMAQVREWAAAMDEATAAIERQRAEINNLDLATSAWAETQQRMSNLSGQSTEFMAAAEEQFKKTGQALYTMTIMQTEFTKATEDQIAALHRLDAKLIETWEGSGPGQRAQDAIAQMVQQFQAGILSLDGFNKQFAYLEEQLDRVIKAGGDLDGSLKGVLEALRSVAQQIRQGPAGTKPTGPVGY